MTVRIFTPPNRLAKVLVDKGGRTAAEAVFQADSRLDELEPPLRKAVKMQIGRILALHREGPDAMFAHSLELGDAALNIAEIAGAAKQPAVGEVARGIRAMIDSQVSAGLWHSEALDLHIYALGLLRTQSGVPPKDVVVMMKQLDEMRRALGVLD